MSVPEKPPDGPGGTVDDVDMSTGAASLEAQQAQNGSENGGATKKHQQKRAPINVEYTTADSGPYRIYFEPLIEGDRINKFSLGSALRKMDQYRKHIVDMKQVGRNKIMVYINSYVKANSLIQDVEAGIIGDYRAYVPLHLVCVTGVIAGVPADIPIEEIQEDIVCEVPIVSVRRLNRFVDGAPTPTNRISIRFRSNVLPERIRLFCCSSRVTPFVQKLVICENCLRFNHRAANCKGKKRCERCSVQHENAEQFRNCANEAKCAFCKSTTHTSGSQDCPEKARQYNIKRLMAKQTLTYAEAREQFPVTSNMYAPLENIDEYPALQNSFATMTEGTFTNTLREQWAQTNQPRNKITPAVKIFQGKDNNKKPAGSKRPRTNSKSKDEKSNNNNKQSELNSGSEARIETVTGTALNNPFKVTEKERWEHIQQQERRKAELAASQNVKSTMMLFYTEFLNQLENSEELKRKFKSCTEKHFNLANNVVGNPKK